MFHPKLLREDYVVDSLQTVDESVLLDDPVFSRGGWIDTINEVKVQYTELFTEPGGGGRPFCECEDVSISYETLDMKICETQTLSVADGVEECSYKWEITSGGGSLSEESGNSTVYTAGGSDIEVVISLITMGTVCDTITIYLICGVSIGYTTQQMSVSEEQTLEVETPVENCTYFWTLEGGGSLSTYVGLITVYTAPDENPYCSLNPGIKLWVLGNETPCDALNIAIDGIEGIAGYEAYCLRGRAVGICSWQIFKYNFYCDGKVSGVPGVCSEGHALACTVEEYAAWAFIGCEAERAKCNENCPDGCEDGYHDTRTLEQEGYGCCPWQLL